MDHFFVSYHFIYLMAQSAPHWWGMFFTQQTLCLPHVFFVHSLWYIGIYTVDVRVTGYKTPGEFSDNITVSSYDTTHLQENPQRLK